MKCLRFSALIALAGLAISCADSPPEKTQEVIHQTEPVAAWINAVKTTDLALFKTVWSKRLLDNEGFGEQKGGEQKGVRNQIRLLVPDS